MGIYYVSMYIRRRLIIEYICYSILCYITLCYAMLCYVCYVISSQFQW